MFPKWWQAREFEIHHRAHHLNWWKWEFSCGLIGYCSNFLLVYHSGVGLPLSKFKRLWSNPYLSFFLLLGFNWILINTFWWFRYKLWLSVVLSSIGGSSGRGGHGHNSDSKKGQFRKKKRWLGLPMRQFFKKISSLSSPHPPIAKYWIRLCFRDYISTKSIAFSPETKEYWKQVRRSDILQISMCYYLIKRL